VNDVPGTIPPVANLGILAIAAITEATAAPANSQPTTGVSVAEVTPLITASVCLAVIKSLIAGIACAMLETTPAPHWRYAAVLSFVIPDKELIILPTA